MIFTSNKKRKWIVASAWPYVNATPHIGNLIGSTLSADVFARFLRMKGDEVVFVSGSDSHGTPISVEVDKINKNRSVLISEKELAFKYHKKIKELHEKWQISFDNYTITHNPTHIEYVQSFYRYLQKKGYICEKEIESFYCNNDYKFLSDRYIEGVCPHCQYEGARGDQCDNCQKLLNPSALTKPRCATCGNTPTIKKTKHWYFNLPQLQDQLKILINENKNLPSNARNLCLSWIDEGLNERAITRDLKWGIPAPFKSSENKTMYVWMEAVIGYISAVKEWAEKIVNDPEKFNYFWNDPNTRIVYFIGKDNIIFHLIIFPALLLAYNKDNKNKLTLPYNISSTEFLMYKGIPFSKSRRVGIWIDDALELAPLDYWRFNLVYNRPEKKDTSFLWSEFDNTNKILNNNVGNFIHRCLIFINKQFNGIIPKKDKLDNVDKTFISEIKIISKKVGELIEKCELRKALREIINFASRCNLYLNNKSPWHLIKKDKKATGHVFNICIQAIYALAVLLGPFIPDTSEKILSYLNNSKLEKIKWESICEDSIKARQKIKNSKPLFKKLNVEEIQKKLKTKKKSMTNH